MTSAALVLVAVVLADRSVRGVLRGIGFGAVGMVGFAAYLGYSWHATGNPLIITSAETTGWGAHLTYPMHMVLVELSRSTPWHDVVRGVDVSGQMRGVFLLDGVAGLVAAAVTVGGCVLAVRHRRLVLPVLLLLMGLLVSVTTISSTADSTARYVLYLAPLYVVAAVLLDALPPVARLPTALQVLAVCAALATFFGAVFTLGYWLPG